MKLATYKDGSRDGQLVVVSRDLASAHFATDIATRMQQVLDDWNFISPQLQDLYVTLNQGRARHAFAFEPRQCMAPLPRAFQLACLPAYPSHGQRLSDAAMAPLAETSWQGAADDLQGPHDDAWFASADTQIDLEAGLAAITGDLAQGVNASQGLDGVRLLVLANTWCLRGLLPATPGDEAAADAPLARLQSRPTAAFAPVAVTPDELGDAWSRGRVQLGLNCTVRGKRLGLCDAGTDMARHFGELIAGLARTRRLRAGCIVATGPISNTDAARGFACLAEKRAAEVLAGGSPRTDYLVFGDAVQIDMKGLDGQSIFGALSQRVVGPGMDSQVPTPVETLVKDPASSSDTA